MLPFSVTPSIIIVIRRTTGSFWKAHIHSRFLGVLTQWQKKNVGCRCLQPPQRKLMNPKSTRKREVSTGACTCAYICNYIQNSSGKKNRGEKKHIRNEKTLIMIYEAQWVGAEFPSWQWLLTVGSCVHRDLSLPAGLLKTETVPRSHKHCFLLSIIAQTPPPALKTNVL